MENVRNRNSKNVRKEWNRTRKSLAKGYFLLKCNSIFSTNTVSIDILEHY